MTYNPDIHRRRSIRLKNYDYSQNGAYFITICTHGKACLFGHIVGAGSKPAHAVSRSKPAHAVPTRSKPIRAPLTAHDKPIDIKSPRMNMNETGRLVEHTWSDLINHINGIELDEFIVMPNHVHGIVVIGRAGSKRTEKNHGLSEIVRQFKTFSARRINSLRKTPGVPLWQRNYYEHIIRNENDYFRIAEYIIDNPLTWEFDENNPASL